MITIANAIQKLLSAHPTYGEALQEGIVNYSALARKIQPDIQDLLLEDVTEGAIVMALRRHSQYLMEKYPREHIHPVQNITVRSDITELAFQTTPALNEIHQKLLLIANTYDHPFLAYGQGTAETTFDLSTVLVPHLEKMIKGEKLIARYDTLSAISVRLSTNTVTIPGVYYPFVKALAWENINVYQIISYFTEVNFIVDDKDIEKTFVLMKTLAKRAKE